MPSEATARLPEPDSAVNLDFFRMRDDFVRIYKPVTEEQRLLTIQMARAWQHLQEVYDLRAQLTAERGLFGLYNDDFEKYKFLMRTLTDAERMWRNALQQFHRARRVTHPGVRETPVTEVRPIRVSGNDSIALPAITSNQITPITRRTSSEGVQPSATPPVDQDPLGPGGLQNSAQAAGDGTHQKTETRDLLAGIEGVSPVPDLRNAKKSAETARRPPAGSS
jgi:hypothetical protein